MTETFTGVVSELGGIEMSKDGTKEKPRKVIIKEDVAKQYGKTFRCWSNQPEWDELEALRGKQVTVEFEVSQPNYTLPNGQTPNPSNMIVSVSSANGEGRGGDWSVPDPGRGSAGEGASQSPPASKDDYWEQRQIMDEQRSLEMEAAWSVKAILDRTPLETEIKFSELVDKAIDLIVIKRQVAHHMGEGQ